ncbi:single-stranded-DNA-specific exonuclease RecJ [Desulfolithobacter sp.]
MKPTRTVLQPVHTSHDQRTYQRLAKKLGIPLPLATILCQRGLCEADEAARFLHPQLAQLPPPEKMQDMDKAVDQVMCAFQNKQQVIIHGDYDVDGISATALLVSFLRTLDMDVRWHIPNRLVEGYGLHRDVIGALAAQVRMPALLVTVDCGVAAVEEVAQARQLGFRVVVTDHHLPGDTLPPAEALLNPQRKDCAFPFPALSGVGVAFYLAWGIRNRLLREGFWNKESAPNLKRYMDLVALGTVADVMPMLEANRILVRAGLEVLTERGRPGIWALCEQAGLREGRIRAEDIGFRLAPRINAAGRLGKPELAIQLLLCQEADEAMEIAASLEEANQERRIIESRSTGDALEKARNQVAAGKRGLVVYGDNYHPGIVGIVASRVVDAFGLPTIILTDEIGGSAGIVKGSGRSIEGVNLYDILSRCEQYLIHYGGHAMAAGLTLNANMLKEFTEMFDRLCVEMIRGERKDRVVYDYQARSAEIFSRQFIQTYEWLEPFGEGNPEPVFLLDRLRLLQADTLKEHLRFRVKLNNTIYRGIGFGMGAKLTQARARSVRLAFRLKSSVFRGEERIELHAVHIEPTD